ncbi:TPA: hypothetical protein ACVGOL_006189 [Pseudomonas aeruginosa]
MTDPKNLENWLHEKAGPAYDALKADPARAVTPDQVRRTLDELLAEAEAKADPAYSSTPTKSRRGPGPRTA